MNLFFLFFQFCSYFHCLHRNLICVTQKFRCRQARGRDCGASAIFLIFRGHRVSIKFQRIAVWLRQSKSNYFGKYYFQEILAAMVVTNSQQRATNKIIRDKNLLTSLTILTRVIEVGRVVTNFFFQWLIRVAKNKKNNNNLKILDSETISSKK